MIDSGGAGACLEGPVLQAYIEACAFTTHRHGDPATDIQQRLALGCRGLGMQKETSVDTFNVAKRSTCDDDLGNVRPTKSSSSYPPVVSQRKDQEGAPA